MRPLAHSVLYPLCLLYTSFADRLDLPITQPYAILLLIVSAVILYRYRRLFNDIERRQTKWVVLGLLVFFAGVPLWTYTFEIATPAVGRDSLLLVLVGWTVLMLITLVLPATIFISIFRHQLWDIDLILNRTLVYSGMSIGIVAVYAPVSYTHLDVYKRQARRCLRAEAPMSRAPAARSAPPSSCTSPAP